MKKIIASFIFLILVLNLITGCGCSRKKEIQKENDKNENQTVVGDQIYEGLEFVNSGINDDTVTTIVINNTGIVYEGSKFSMKIMDEKGNVLEEIEDEVKGPVENGTIKEIETKINSDLSNATSIEYSIIKN